MLFPMGVLEVLACLLVTAVGAMKCSGYLTIIEGIRKFTLKVRQGLLSTLMDRWTLAVRLSTDYDMGDV